MSILASQSKGSTRATLKNPRFHARLRRLIGVEAPYAWAERMGISKGAFTRIWKEGTVPTSELLYRIRAATGVSLDWLLTGQGGPSRTESPSAELAYIGEYMPPQTAPRSRRKPPAAGQGQIALMRAWVQQWLDTEPADLAYVPVKGESMAPTLSDGDLVLIDRRAATLEQEGIYVLRQGSTLRIRRVQRLSGESYQAISDNPRYHPFTFRVTSRMSVVGRVVWVGKRM